MRRAAGLGVTTVIFSVLALLMAAAGAVAVPSKLGHSIRTDIHDASNQVVTVGTLGTTVHDFVTVKGQLGQPVPTGSVDVEWFLNGTCTGIHAARSGLIGPLDANGQFEATVFSFKLTAFGARSFRANYFGDNNYFGVDGACEPLKVVPPGIVGLDKVSFGQNVVVAATTRRPRRTAGLRRQRVQQWSGRSCEA